MKSMRDIAKVLFKLESLQLKYGVTFTEAELFEPENDDNDTLIIWFNGTYITPETPLSIIVSTPDDMVSQIEGIEKAYRAIVEFNKRKDEEIEKLKFDLEMARAVASGIEERESRKM